MKSTHTQKPWGYFEQFTDNAASTVKILFVEKGKRLSLQSHSKRDEFWKVLDNGLAIQLDDEIIEPEAGDELFIERGTKHRLIGKDSSGRVLEISVGHFDETDIERHEDDFGRQGSTDV